jgi:hypothetical protein
MHPFDVDARPCSNPQMKIEACSPGSPGKQSGSTSQMVCNPQNVTALLSTWTIAGSTTDSNGSSTTTRGRRRFRRRRKCLLLQGMEVPLKSANIASGIMEVEFIHKAWEACSQKCATEACDADISSLSDFGDSADDVSSDNNSVSSTSGTKNTAWSDFRRTPHKSNVSRKLGVL